MKRNSDLILTLLPLPTSALRKNISKFPANFFSNFVSYRYLEKECKDLPSLGSEERNKIRTGISLSQYLHQLQEQMVEGE